MEENLGGLSVNSHHETELYSYLRFCKGQRTLSLRSARASFSDAKACLNEDTFTKEEVEELLDCVCGSVSDEIEGELVHTAHSNSAILSSLFRQAEKWYLNLSIDVVAAENQEDLSVIRHLDETGSLEKRKPSQLAPLQADPAKGPSALLETKIQQLTQENAGLQQALHELNEKVKKLSLENENLGLDVSFAHKEVSHLKNTLEDRPKKDDIHQLNDEVAKIQNEFSSKDQKNAELNQKVQAELADAKASLRAVKAKLELAEKEFAGKFHDTSGYHNMKKMLATKNDRIKFLHQRLLQYETEDDILKAQDQPT